MASDEIVWYGSTCCCVGMIYTDTSQAIHQPELLRFQNQVRIPRLVSYMYHAAKSQLTSLSRTPNNQKQTNFCRNEYNVSGLCNRQSCPLANSRYASVRPHPEKPNVLYLYMKTVERAHLPNRMWEKIRLPSNYQKALAMIDEKLMYGIPTT